LVLYTGFLIGTVLLVIHGMVKRNLLTVVSRLLSTGWFQERIRVN